MAGSTVLHHTAYTIVLVCPMSIELAPVEAMLDEIHQQPTCSSHPVSAYTFGKVAGHNVVVTVMPDTGNNLAAILATRIRHDFPSIRFGLLIGVGGGVPGSRADVRLGDVVVSRDVIQYDLGKKLSGGNFKVTGHPIKPPDILMSHVRTLEGQYHREGCKLQDRLEQMLETHPKMRTKYSRPRKDDLLFHSSCVHESGDDCTTCDHEQLVSRSTRDDLQPRIHVGTIGSANILLRDAIVRDQLGTNLEILCVEMEAAGMIASFPCLVIRGICDYADSHKNKTFQPYAAAMAAVYCKELLSILPVEAPNKGPASDQGKGSGFKRRSYFNNAPEMDSALFVGRSDDLLSMHNILQPNSSQENQTRLILSGIGGIGKTQLAIRYAKQYSSSYDLVFWFDASSEAILNNEIQRTAHRIPQTGSRPGSDTQKDLFSFLDWLTAVETSRWLIIYDNYDDPELFNIKQYYPNTFHGSIIITTRTSGRIQGRALTIEPFDNTNHRLQALELRSRRSGVTEDSDARRLVNRLGGIPLALATVGDFLGKSSWSFRDYLEEYEKQWKINTRKAIHLLDYPNRTLYTTWNISYQKLENEDPDAAHLLKLLGYFGSQNISHDLFKDTDKYESGLRFSTIAERREFEGTMSVLVGLGFFRVQQDTKSYNVNVCVHDWMLSGLNETLDADLYWYAFDCLCSCIPDEMCQDDYLDRAWLACHAKQLTKQTLLESFWSKVSLDRCVAAGDLVVPLLGYTSQSTAATALLRKISPQIRKELGHKSWRFLNIQRQLCSSYRMEGKFFYAEKIILDLLPIAEAELGTNHVITAEIVNCSANLAHAQNKIEEAEELYLRTIELCEKIHGPEDRRTLIAKNNLGKILRIQGRLEDAERTLTEALARSRESLGSETVTTVRLVEDLGRVYHVQRRTGDAEAVLNQALAQWEQFFGSDHPETREARVELGRFYLDTGKPDEAIEVLSKLSATLKDDPGNIEVISSNTAALLSEAQRRAQITDTSIEEVQHSGPSTLSLPLRIKAPKQLPHKGSSKISDLSTGARSTKTRKLYGDGRDLPRGGEPGDPDGR